MLLTKTTHFVVDYFGCLVTFSPIVSTLLAPYVSVAICVSGRQEGLKKATHQKHKRQPENIE